MQHSLRRLRLLLFLAVGLSCGSGIISTHRPAEDSAPITPPEAPTELKRGGDFMGVAERFNRYYTDPEYTVSSTIYVSRNGGGSGDSRATPTTVDDGFARVSAGGQITFLRDTEPYAGCWQLDGEQSGSYDDPIVLYAERNEDGSRGVHINCCNTGRKSCFNLEFSNYVAVDGFEMQGGRYGIRTVGEGYAPNSNQRGIAMLNNEAYDQCGDPLFSGQSSWIVAERNVAHGAGSCDGHGIYLSNGGDYMLVRGNNVYDNASSDFQINADPISTCEDEGLAYDDPLCDGPVGENQGQGISEYVLVEDNYFHHGNAQGPNFTSVRNSIIRNNVIGPYATHGTSFWQETDNPNLGSANNQIHHNLFMGSSNRNILQFIRGADHNDVRNNLIIAIGGNPVLLESDTDGNAMVGNYYVGTKFDGYAPNSEEYIGPSFNAAWFSNFPSNSAGKAEDFKPSANAPYRSLGSFLRATPRDLSEAPRMEPTSLGPLER